MSFSAMSEKTKLICLVIFTGIVYSLFINPMTTEHAEFAQSLAGQIDLNAMNHFAKGRHNDPSLQVILPAIFIKMGVSAMTMAKFSSIVSQTIPFLAIALLVFFLTENFTLSYLSILFFIGSASSMNHFYVLQFPADFFVFGNLANWAAALCIGLAFNNYKKTAVFFTGLMISIHLVWACTAIVYCFYIFRKDSRKKLLLAIFAAGVAVSAGSFYLHNYFKVNYMEKRVYKVPEPSVIPEEWKAPPLSIATPAPAPAYVKRNAADGHLPVLIGGDWLKMIKQFALLLEFSAFVFLLGFYLRKRGLLPKEKLDAILVPYGLIVLGSLAGSAFIEITEMTETLQYLNGLARRMVPNRFLNLSYIWCMVLITAGLFSVFMRSRTWIFKGLAAVGFLLLAIHFYSFTPILIVLIIAVGSTEDRIVGKFLAPRPAKS